MKRARLLGVAAWVLAALGMGVASGAARRGLEAHRGLEARHWDNPSFAGEPIRVARTNAIHLLDLAFREHELPKRQTSIDWRGWLHVTEGGLFRFDCAADDWAELEIDGVLVARAGIGAHVRGGELDLEPGLHRVQARYVQDRGGLTLRLRWTRPGHPEESLSLAPFYRTIPGGDAAGFARMRSLARRGPAAAVALAVVAIVWAWLSIEDRVRRRRLAVGAGALGAMLIVVALAAELAARLARPGEPPAVPEIAGPENALGFRDVDHAAARPAGTVRIACLGDSFTYAAGVPFEHSYCRRLASGLEQDERATAAAYEAINVSKPGWSAPEEIHALESYRILDLDPSVLVLGYVLNDPEDDDIPSAWREMRRPILPREPTGWVAAAARRSALAARVYARLENTRRYRALTEYYRDLHRPTFQGWRHLTDSFERLGELTGGAGTRVLVAIFPLLDFPLGPAYPFGEQHAQVAELARGLGFEVLDLRSAYEGYDPAETNLVPGVDPHPSDLGHRIAAVAIREKLIELGWVGGAP